MKIHSITFIFAAVICLTLFSLSSDAQGIRKLRQEVYSLKLTNSTLKDKVDSLMSVIQQQNESLDSLKGIIPPPVDDQAQFEISDSLLREWYILKDNISSTAYDMEVEQFSSDVPDEVFLDRLEAMNSFIRLPFNNIVKNYCILYSEKIPQKMGRVLALGEYYWPMIEETLNHYGLPLELKNLVIIESLLDPTATSRVGAKGLWQFMYMTAKGYGLRIDSWMDERMDPFKSTDAAARYLRDTYKMFGDWMLVLASYNCGPGNVMKAIRRSGGKSDFWQIYDYLPRETRGYVPAFVGASYALYYYKEYSLKRTDVLVKVPVDTFKINKNLHFGQVSEMLGVPMDVLSSYNPQYLHDVVPGETSECILRLPVEFSNAFVDAADSLYNYQKERFFNPVQIEKIQNDIPSSSSGRIVYKVKSGDVLGKIARRYGVSVSQIRKWNSLRSDSIRIGQKLVIYRRR